jgi:hypothetical protein
MKRFSTYVLALSLAVSWVCLLAAQEKPSVPKVLQITRERQSR